eukprot:TRINITY_DN14665_c0_g1_i1.p1 TRINITY_DN14665_c0_g1~~TRINITY_DN14665_c0_g1_i1.p1  ORF type:complete len:171 (-),score=29.87 TRINITY_DN14665_c0_g1_i1:53-565(-)
MSTKCAVCSKAVYAMELTKAVGKNYHKTCLKCKTCKKTLSNGNWSDRGTDVYCNACYEKNFVDDETKQQIFELESNYAKKVHGSAVSILGNGGPPPPVIKKPGQNQTSPVAPPPPTSPRKAMPSVLQSAIVSSQGSPRAGMSSTASSHVPLKSSGNSAPTGFGGFNRAKK